QSGSNTVLERMRRRYTIEQFLDMIDRMRQRLVKPAFTTDVIVGFPGETDQEFQETMQACRDAKFMKIHIFPFSPRRGTPAATLPEQVHGTLRDLRMRELERLERELAREYYTCLVQDRIEVLIEGQVENRPGWVHGADRHHVPVEIPGDHR